MTKLKSTDGEGKVVDMFFGPAMMDAFSAADEFIYTSPVSKVTKYIEDDGVTLLVITPVNSYYYLIDEGTKVIRDSDDGSISFVSRGKKYRIRAAKDSENFNVPTYV